MRIVYWILHRILPQIIFFIENSESIYLTIDDSPSEHTMEILDILDGFGVKASFFCVGENIDKFPSQFNEIIKRCHTIGYHSYSHDNAWKTTKLSQDLILDFEKNKLQFESNFYRSPYGMLTWGLFRHISTQHKIIFWDILTEDWKQNIDPIQKIKSKIRNLKKGSIIVFHDNQKSKLNCTIMLKYFLNYIKEKELKLATLSNS